MSENYNFYTMRNSSKGINGLKELIECVNRFKPVNELTMIEIGSYIGESTVVFANAFKQVISIDPYVDNYDATDHACKHAPFEKVYERFLYNTRLFSNIKHIRKFSDQAILDFENNSIDFVYIDGNHQYEFVKKDIENYYKVIKPYGFLGGHDYSCKAVKKAIEDTIFQIDYDFQDSSWVKIKTN